jgi:Tfp pilus assembly protein PilP
MRHWIVGLVGACLLAGPARAQEKREGEAQGDSIRQLLEREVEPAAGQYMYAAAGRRDPFVSLMKPIEGGGGVGKRPVGMDGFLIQEVTLRGVVKTKEGFVALLVGPDGKSYFPKLGQRLYDGSITAIDQGSVTFRQEVSDPLAPVKVRDVKKSLYASEEARQ